MPIQRCSSKSKRGWRWGKHGKCYLGTRGKAKAQRQMRAILATGWTENADTCGAGSPGGQGFQKGNTCSYHGTSAEHGSSIKEGGLKAKIGAGGKGVYTTTEFGEAIEYGLYALGRKGEIKLGSQLAIAVIESSESEPAGKWRVFTKDVPPSKVQEIRHYDALRVQQFLRGKETYPTPEEFEPFRVTTNVFCPTGPGGGVDPTCKKDEVLWESRGAEGVASRFKIGTVPYAFYAMPHGGDSWEVGFVQLLEEGANDLDPDKIEIGLTGVGNPIKVLNQAILRLQSFIEKYQPKMFEFTAEEPSRQRLYAKMLNRLAIPGYTRVPIKKYGTYTNEYSTKQFVFTSRPVVITGNVFCPTGEGGGIDPTCSPPNAGTKQTETPAFKKWFGKSKVVDKDGKPLVVYHGTKSSFKQFRIEEDDGIWFTSERDRSGEVYAAGEGGNVLPCFLQISNPYYGSSHAILKAKELGHDGIISKSKNLRTGENETVYVVFNPQQIKSATGNRGTFDPDDPIITHALVRNAKRVNTNPLQRDPTRTATLRRMFEREMLRRLNTLRKRVVDLLVKEDAFGLVERRPYALNVFCPTGPGGGVDPTCSPPGDRRSDLVRIFTEATNRLTDQYQILDKIEADWHTIQFVNKKEGYVEQTVNLKITVHGDLLLNNVYIPGSLRGKGLLTQVLSAIRKLPKMSGRLQVDVGMNVRGWATIAERAGFTIVPYTSNVFCPTGEGGGVNPTCSMHKGVANTRYKFLTLAEKVKAFGRWLIWAIAHDLIPDYGGEEDTWWDRYVKWGWREGAGRAFEDVRSNDRYGLSEQPNIFGVSKEEFLRRAFSNPISIEKLKLLAGRVLTELQGMTEQMATRLKRELADGLVKGQNPRVIARNITKAIDVTKASALRIARTEITRVHAEGTLDAMEAQGVTEVGVMVEWHVSGLGTTKKGNPTPCKICAPLAHVVMTVKEAHGLLPRHPNCMCTFMPANVGERDKKQKFTAAKIREAIDASIKAEMPKRKKRTLAEQKRRTRWSGADAKIAKMRPKRFLIK